MIVYSGALKVLADNNPSRYAKSTHSLKEATSLDLYKPV
jgi:hypothetical protein